MSPVVPIAFAVAGGAGIVTSCLIMWIGRRLRTRRTINILAALSGIAVVLASVIPAIVLLSTTATTARIAIDPREGEKRLAQFGLPANTTSDFCYRISAVGISVLADFQMSEADFLSWMSSQRWKTVAFDHGPNESAITVENANFPNFHTDDLVYPVREYESRTERQVKRGYCYYWSMPGNFDNTIKIIYDRDTNRAYLEHTTY